jgi:hypothetical protein
MVLLCTGNSQMPMLKSDVNDNAAKVLPLSAIMDRLKVDSALHQVRLAGDPAFFVEGWHLTAVAQAGSCD